jgi:hypothetical protein
LRQKRKGELTKSGRNGKGHKYKGNKPKRKGHKEKWHNLGFLAGKGQEGLYQSLFYQNPDLLE